MHPTMAKKHEQRPSMSIILSYACMYLVNIACCTQLVHERQVGWGDAHAKEAYDVRMRALSFALHFKAGNCLSL